MKKSKGFTIVELIVVIVILGLIAFLMVPRLTGFVDNTRVKRIQQDIRMAENKILEGSIMNDNLTEEWSSIEEEKLRNLGSGGKLFTKEGLTSYISPGKYKVVDEEFLSEYVSTNLEGTFYKDNYDNIYYQTGSETGNIFDVSLMNEGIEQDEIEITSFNLPNGVYTYGDFIYGSIKVKGLKKGVYKIESCYTPKIEQGRIGSFVNFEINENESKTIDFNYEIKEDDIDGFYNSSLTIKNEDGEIVEQHLAIENIYIGQPKWRYYEEKDLERKLEPVVKKSMFRRSAPTSSVSSVSNDGIVGLGKSMSKDSITYSSYEAKMKVIDNDTLKNSFFMYGENDDVEYKISMDVLLKNGEWQVWTTVYNESHMCYNNEYKEKGVVFHDVIDVEFDPSEDFNNYRIDFYSDHIKFLLNDEEISRWDDSFNYGEMNLNTDTYHVSWPTGKTSPTPLEMNVEWIRKGYFN